MLVYADCKSATTAGLHKLHEDVMLVYNRNEVWNVTGDCICGNTRYVPVLIRLGVMYN